MAGMGEALGVTQRGSRLGGHGHERVHTEKQDDPRGR